MHVHPHAAAIPQLTLQPDVVVRDAFVGIELWHHAWIDSVDLAVDGLIAEPEHWIATKRAEPDSIKAAILVALSPCQQMMGRSA